MVTCHSTWRALQCPCMTLSGYLRSLRDCEHSSALKMHQGQHLTKSDGSRNLKSVGLEIWGQLVEFGDAPPGASQDELSTSQGLTGQAMPCRNSSEKCGRTGGRWWQHGSGTLWDADANWISLISSKAKPSQKCERKSCTSCAGLFRKRYGNLGQQGCFLQAPILSTSACLAN